MTIIKIFKFGACRIRDFTVYLNNPDNFFMVTGREITDSNK